MSKSQNSKKVDSLFPAFLPLVKTPKEVEHIQKLYPSYDPYFIASGVIEERREKFNKLWPRYKPYADNNFIKEIRTNFHQRTWEMYMGNILLDNNIKIFSKDKGPDFIIKNDNNEDLLYIECVCTGKGKNENSTGTPFNDSQENNTVPIDKMILRIRSSIDQKVKNYKEYKNKQIIKSNIPFIIAINTADSSWIEGFTSNVIKALFGIGDLQINMETGEQTHSIKDEIKKTNGAPVNVNIFKTKEFAFISGAIFSNIHILNHPNKLGDDCTIVNNPFAAYPIPEFPGYFTHIFKSYHSYFSDNGNQYLKRNF